MSQGQGFEQVPSHLWQYAQHQDLLAEAAGETKRFLTELARDASIDVHLVEARPKTLASYTEKSQKAKDDGSPKYSDPAGQIHDCVAARVIVYTTRARNDLADLIVSRCTFRERQNPGDIKHNGYDSEHIVISGIKDPEVQRRYGALAKYLGEYQGLEIQVRSVAGHAWAEYEHDIRWTGRSVLRCRTRGSPSSPYCQAAKFSPPGLLNTARTGTNRTAPVSETAQAGRTRTTRSKAHPSFLRCHGLGLAGEADRAGIGLGL